MSKRDRDFRGGKSPKRESSAEVGWVAPTYEQRQAARKAPDPVPSQPLTVEQELSIATMDRLIPSVDFHGQTREDVRWQIDQLLQDNPGRCVRIIYGRGRGIIEGEVMTYIRQLHGRRNSPIIAFRPDIHTHSLVVRVRGNG